jgi:hypothetical protein
MKYGLLVVLALGLSGSAAAAPHKILVLPVDGTADAATRARLTTHLVKLAKSADGQVSTAEATFADAALAVGCDPQARGCANQVLATLAVDELVWATATKDSGQTKLVVRRATQGAAPREVSTTIASGDSADHIDAAMAPLFPRSGITPEPTARSPATTPSAAAVPPPQTGEVAPEPAPASGASSGATPGLDAGPADHDHDRTIGIAFAAGGGVALVLGLALWSSYASLQNSIDSHSTSSRAAFDDLIALEDRAGTYAIAGDGFVLVGLAAGGLGAYLLYRSHNRHRIAVTPAPVGGGAGLLLTIPGGLR